MKKPCKKLSGKMFQAESKAEVKFLRRVCPWHIQRKAGNLE
jgi:hypothetical protein